MNKWINLNGSYTPVNDIIFGVGCAFWVLIYVIVIHDIIKYKSLGIPFLAVCANFGWEIVWGFVLKTNMGYLFQMGYVVWGILDIFIFYHVIKYAPKTIKNPFVRKYIVPILIFWCLMWGALAYSFAMQIAMIIGATTAYMVNAQMSALYFVELFHDPTNRAYRPSIGWYKMVGTGLNSVFCFIVWPNQYFLLVLCSATFVMDLCYVIFFKQLKAAGMQLTRIIDLGERAELSERS